MNQKVDGGVDYETLNSPPKIVNSFSRKLSQFATFDNHNGT
jgi:hypothetical protein